MASGQAKVGNKAGEGRGAGRLRASQVEQEGGGRGENELMIGKKEGCTGGSRLRMSSEKGFQRREGRRGDGKEGDCVEGGRERGILSGDEREGGAEDREGEERTVAQRGKASTCPALGLASSLDQPSR